MHRPRGENFALAEKRRLKDVQQGTRTWVSPWVSVQYSFFLNFWLFEFAGNARFVVSNVRNLCLVYESKLTWMGRAKKDLSFLSVWKRGKADSHQSEKFRSMTSGANPTKQRNRIVGTSREDKRLKKIQYMAAFSLHPLLFVVKWTDGDGHS